MNQIKFLRFSIIFVPLIFLLCGYLVSHHESYDFIFVVSHTIINKTTDTVSCKFYRSKSSMIMKPNERVTKSYLHNTSSTMANSALILYGDSLSDSVQVTMHSNSNNFRVIFKFDSVTYSADDFINAKPNNENNLYSDTFNITDANCTNGIRWVVMGKSIFE